MCITHADSPFRQELYTTGQDAPLARDIYGHGRAAAAAGRKLGFCRPTVVTGSVRIVQQGRRKIDGVGACRFDRVEGVLFLFFLLLFPLPNTIIPLPPPTLLFPFWAFFFIDTSYRVLSTYPVCLVFRPCCVVVNDVACKNCGIHCGVLARFLFVCYFFLPFID